MFRAEIVGFKLLKQNFFKNLFINVGFLNFFKSSLLVDSAVFHDVNEIKMAQIVKSVSYYDSGFSLKLLFEATFDYFLSDLNVNCAENEN